MKHLVYQYPKVNHTGVMTWIFVLYEEHTRTRISSWQVCFILWYSEEDFIDIFYQFLVLVFFFHYPNFVCCFSYLHFYSEITSFYIKYFVLPYSIDVVSTLSYKIDFLLLFSGINNLNCIHHRCPSGVPRLVGLRVHEDTIRRLPQK